MGEQNTCIRTTRLSHAHNLLIQLRHVLQEYEFEPNVHKGLAYYERSLQTRMATSDMSVPPLCDEDQEQIQSMLDMVHEDPTTLRYVIEEVASRGMLDDLANSQSISNELEHDRN